MAERGLLLKEGTLVDATIIEAPSSTKNREGKRDPQMHQARKGKQWHFGMRAHIGVDVDSGRVHTVVATCAQVSDVTQADRLLHGEEVMAFGDTGYRGMDRRPERTHRQVRWHVAMRPGKCRRLAHDSLGRARERLEQAKARIRAKVEHPFQIIKQRFGHRKVRYRGLAKNHAQLYMLFAMANRVRGESQLLGT